MNDRQTNRNPAIPGHALARRGVPVDEEGNTVWRRLGWENSTAGPGRAMCQCGAISPELSGPSRRRAWHNEHKDALRSTVVPPRTWMAMPAMQTLAGQHWVLVSGTWPDIHLPYECTEEQAHALARRLNGGDEA